MTEKAGAIVRSYTLELALRPKGRTVEGGKWALVTKNLHGEVRHRLSIYYTVYITFVRLLMDIACQEE